MKIPKGCKVYSVCIISGEDDSFIKKTKKAIPAYFYGISNESIMFGTIVSTFLYFEGNILARSKEHAKERIYHKFLQLFDGNMGKWEKVLLDILEKL